MFSEFNLTFIYLLIRCISSLNKVLWFPYNAIHYTYVYPHLTQLSYHFHPSILSNKQKNNEINKTGKYIHPRLIPKKKKKNRRKEANNKIIHPFNLSSFLKFRFRVTYTLTLWRNWQYKRGISSEISAAKCHLRPTTSVCHSWRQTTTASFTLAWKGDKTRMFGFTYLLTGNGLQYIGYLMLYLIIIFCGEEFVVFDNMCFFRRFVKNEINREQNIFQYLFFHLFIYLIFFLSRLGLMC